MPSTHDEFSQLFRTLGADNASIPAQRPAAIAREAEQRWPLLGALPPQKPASIPALTEEEKQLRNSAHRPDPALRKPALTLPGVGDKLAFSLNKMTGMQNPVSSAVRVHAAQPAVDPARHEEPQPAASPERRSPFSRMRTDPPQHAADAKPGLFANSNKTASAPAASNTSLAGVFSRLEHKEEEKPAGNRLSFLGRLGKR